MTPVASSASSCIPAGSAQLTCSTRNAALFIGTIVIMMLTQLVHGADATAVKPVKIMTLASQDMNVERTFFGRVSARQSVDLAFQVAGQLFNFPAVEGARISKAP